MELHGELVCVRSNSTRSRRKLGREDEDVHAGRLAWYAPLEAVSLPKPALLRRIESSVRSRLGLPFPWVQSRLLGRQLTLREGTIRDDIDYDDAWFHACARHAEVVFDVGANVGQSALIAMLNPAVRQVVLVEANWAALSVAAENLIRNDLAERARFVCAFADEAANRTVQFWTVGTGAAGSMFEGHAATAASAGSSRQVPTTTLDDIGTLYGVVPDLVKIDVEGAEAKVLAGHKIGAVKNRTRYLVEMHSMRELTMADNATRVLDWCASVGHSAWYLSEGTKLTSPSTIAHRGRCHLLLQPAAWPYPEWLAKIPQSAPLPDSP